MTDQNALTTIAKAISDEVIICGSSAIGEELPAVWQDDLPTSNEMRLPYDENTGILSVAGGETSDAMCKQLYINSFEIHHEIQAGLPSCI